jgi:hypothetical protein
MENCYICGKPGFVSNDFVVEESMSHYGRVSAGSGTITTSYPVGIVRVPLCENCLREKTEIYALHHRRGIMRTRVLGYLLSILFFAVAMYGLYLSIRRNPSNSIMVTILFFLGAIVFAFGTSMYCKKLLQPDLDKTKEVISALNRQIWPMEDLLAKEIFCTTFIPSEQGEHKYRAKGDLTWTLYQGNTPPSKRNQHGLYQQELVVASQYVLVHFKNALIQYKPPFTDTIVKRDTKSQSFNFYFADIYFSDTMVGTEEQKRSRQTMREFYQAHYSNLVK